MTSSSGSPTITRRYCSRARAAGGLREIHGRAYRSGETVDTSQLQSDKVQQLIGQRILQDEDAQRPSRCVAMRAFRLGGKAYARGDAVDMRGVRPDKVSQLLEHRIVDLAQRVSDARPAKRAAK